MKCTPSGLFALVAIAAALCPALAVASPRRDGPDNQAPSAGDDRAVAGWTLERAIAQALARSERLDAAAARREVASARVDRARADRLGDVTATAVATRRAREVTREVGGESVTIQSAYAVAAQVTGRMPLLDLGARAAVRTVRIEREAAGLDEQETRRQVALEVAAGYLAALGSEQVLAAAERRAEYARARLTDAQVRQQAGIAGTAEVSGIELELATAERERATTRAGLDVAYQQLGYLIDAEVAGPLGAPSTLLAAATTVEPAGAEVTAGRFDLAADARRIEAAWVAVEEPRARRWPTLDLAGQVQVNNEPGFAGEYHDWSVAVVATWQLWDGGRRGAEARVLAASARLVEADAAARRRSARTEIATAEVTLAGNRAALIEAERAATAAGRYADDVAVLQQQGLARALEVADAGARRFDADVALARARFGVGLSYLDLLAATGATLAGGVR